MKKVNKIVCVSLMILMMFGGITMVVAGEEVIATFKGIFQQVTTLHIISPVVAEYKIENNGEWISADGSIDLPEMDLYVGENADYYFRFKRLRTIDNPRVRCAMDMGGVIEIIKPSTMEVEYIPLENGTEYTIDGDDFYSVIRCDDFEEGHAESDWITTIIRFTATETAENQRFNMQFSINNALDDIKRNTNTLT